MNKIIKKDKRQIKIVFVCIILIMVSAITLGSSYAFLTKKGVITGTYAMGEVKNDVNFTINGESSIEQNFAIYDIAYIDLANDIAVDNSSLFNTLVTYMDITIENTGDINSGEVSLRNKVEIVDENDNVNIEGLLYLVILDTTTFDNDYSALINSIITNPSYIPIGADFTTITSDDISDIYQAINNYNHSQLKDFYENNNQILDVNETASFRVAFFGNYYGLTNTTNYLTKHFNITIKVKSIQNSYNYGGVDYDQD